MSKVAIIGKYNTVAGIADGQAVKTRIIAQQLGQRFGDHNVRQIDTYNWKKHPLRLVKKSLQAVHGSAHVIFMTDEGGIKVFPWLLRFANAAGKCKLHYVVVGGWLIHFLKKHRFISACLKKFTGIYVETTVMQQALEAQGFQNVVLLPNCKPLEPVSREQLRAQYAPPFRFCTFSRVMKEKGIDDAVDAVRAINRRFGSTVCTLDIYGQVDPGQKEWFASLQSAFPPEVRYCGVIDYEKSVAVLQDCFALLFPTEFFTEGIPGTVIDAYAAGVPVIAARWESFADVIDEGKTGIGYPFSEQQCLQQIMLSLIEDPRQVAEMKENCLCKARQYMPGNVMQILLSRLS